MKNVITVVGLGLGLVASSGVAWAQESSFPVINADGNSGTSNAGLNPAVDADGPTIVYGDINSPAGTTVIGPPAGESAPVAPAPAAIPGTTGDITATDGNAATLGPGSASAAPGTVTRDGDSGTALLGPDGTYSVTEVSASDVTVGDAGAPAPVYEPAPVAAPEVMEGEPGLASTIPDSDSDAVADADEVTIYGTDPWVWDTDGDGLSDGEELFATGTDPLVWNTESGSVSDGGVEIAATTELVAEEGAAPEASGLDSDNDRLADADEVAIGTDPYTPDADGDGYYDGDEANLGTDPFDPASFPTGEGTASSV
jgi:Bacterial TSP3 repeat